MKRDIYNAAYTGAPIALPSWVGVLQTAAAWGIPPWEVTGESVPNRVTWYIRQGVYQAEVARAEQDKAKRRGKKSG